MSRALSVLGAAIWLGVVVWSVLSLQSDAPRMALIGAGLAAMAPLIFVAGLRRWALVSATDPHPVMVSVISGSPSRYGVGDQRLWRRASHDRGQSVRRAI